MKKIMIFFYKRNYSFIFLTNCTFQFTMILLGCCGVLDPFFFMKQCNILLSGDCSTEGKNNLLLLQITEFSWSKVVVEVSDFATKTLGSSSSTNSGWVFFHCWACLKNRDFNGPQIINSSFQKFIHSLNPFLSVPTTNSYETLI